MNFIIRPPVLSDAKDIQLIRTARGTMENILGYPTNTVMESENYLINKLANDHILVAEVERCVIGIAGLHVESNPRMNHIGSFGISIHPDYQSKGIGKALTEAILELADNWLMLIRVELEVFENNKKAIELYRKMGFVIEGLKKYNGKRYGKYENDYVMARYNEKIIGGISNGTNNGE